jgi:hypothetical protein
LEELQAAEVDGAADVTAAVPSLRQKRLFKE